MPRTQFWIRSIRDRKVNSPLSNHCNLFTYLFSTSSICTSYLSSSCGRSWRCLTVPLIFTLGNISQYLQAQQMEVNDHSITPYPSRWLLKGNKCLGTKAIWFSQHKLSQTNYLASYLYVTFLSTWVKEHTWRWHFSQVTSRIDRCAYNLVHWLTCTNPVSACWWSISSSTTNITQLDQLLFCPICKVDQKHIQLIS